MLAEIFEKDRWIRIAHSKVKKSTCYKGSIVDTIDNFLNDYALYYHLTAKNIIDIYNRFTAQYSKHIREFLISGKYPYQYCEPAMLGRIDYDIVLILSVVLSIHRHQIFNHLISAGTKAKGKIDLIGIGSGLEIEFLDTNKNEINAYDISIATHVKSKFHNRVQLHETYFNHKRGECENIFAIELLEHLEQPLEFIKMIYNSLKPGGYFYFTTATNIPQIDHLYNFTDREQFELELQAMGFTIVESEIIEHESIDSKLNASNGWYTLKK
jgi:SAM-dependent methyltransferase